MYNDQHAFNDACSKKHSYENVHYKVSRCQADSLNSDSLYQKMANDVRDILNNDTALYVQIWQDKFHRLDVCNKLVDSLIQMVNKQIDLFNESSSLFKRVDVYVHKSKDNKVYLKFVGWQNFPDSSLKEYIGFIPMKDRIFFVKQCKNSRSINDIFVRRSNVLFQWTEPRYRSVYENPIWSYYLDMGKQVIFYTKTSNLDLWL